MSDTPAAKVIKAFGGVRATARRLNRNSSTISRWQIERERGGTGGRIPASLQGEILELAKEDGLLLTADDLIA